MFCFTPKARLIALPRGATPIDFAYAVHTDVGNTAVGCKINGRMSPLLTELQNGDEVEIIRAEGQTPPAAWESLVVTGKARASIRRATRAAVRQQYTGLGTPDPGAGLRARANAPFRNEKLKGALPRLARLSIEDVLAAVGRGEMFSGDVVRAVYPDYKEDRRAGGRCNRRTANGRRQRRGPTAPGETRHRRHPDPRPQRQPAGALRARGRRGAGRPDRRHPDARRRRDHLPDPIAPRSPISTTNRTAGSTCDGISRRIRSAIPLASSCNPSTSPVRWRRSRRSSPITRAISTTSFMKRRTQDFTDVTIDLGVWDLKHLNAIIAELRAKRTVSRVDRMTG